MFSHPCSRNECPGDRYPKFKICTSELILDSVRNNALHISLIKLSLAFGGTGGFLIRYYNGRTK